MPLAVVRDYVPHFGKRIPVIQSTYCMYQLEVWSRSERCIFAKNASGPLDQRRMQD